MKNKQSPDKNQDVLCLKFRQFALKVGLIEATILLMRKGVSPSVADKLARADYWSIPRNLLAKAINEVMEENK